MDWQPFEKIFRDVDTEGQESRESPCCKPSNDATAKSHRTYVDRVSRNRE
jgi:hypothetical protein